MTEEVRKFDQWALVEIMGHRRLAGRVTEETIAGAALLRVDVPAVDPQPAFTTYVGAGSIFSLTPVSEEIATAHAQSFRASPIMVYEIQRQLLPAPAVAGGRDDDDDVDEWHDGDGRIH
jgi:hypothetical protein